MAEEGMERRKLAIPMAVHKVQISLLEEGPCSQLQLFAAGSLLSRSDYEDVVVERSIAGICGYPCCSEALPTTPSRRGRYRISLSEHKVYDLEETFRFCSESCAVSSSSFSGSLRLDRCSSAGPGKVSEILNLFEKSSARDFRSLAKPVAADGDLGFSKLTIHDRTGAIAGEVAGEVWIGPSNAVEGYVPLRDRRKGFDPEIKANAAISESDFTSTVILPSSSEEEINPEERLERGKEESKSSTALKPSLKKTEAKKGSRGRVKWADEEEVKVFGDGGESYLPSNEEADEILQRLDSAEACAAALVRLAESVSSCDEEPEDAAARQAGILLLPPSNQVEERNSDQGEEDSSAFNEGTVKWPKKTVLLDTDLFEVEDSWHDTPPEGFTLTLSPFATMWNALFGWLTCSSLAFIYGEDEASVDGFMEVNGREYPRKVVLKDGRSSEIKQTMAACIARALPPLATDLCLRVPVSSIEKAMGRLLETMAFVDALPPLRMKQWSVITLLFVDALSLSVLPSLAPQISASAGHSVLQKVIKAAQVSDEQYAAMLDLILPLGGLHASQPSLYDPTADREYQDSRVNSILTSIGAVRLRSGG